MGEPKPDLHAIHSRLLQHADKLFEVLADLEASGGMGELVKSMKPASLERTVNVLKGTRQALDEQLVKLKGLKR